MPRLLLALILAAPLAALAGQNPYVCKLQDHLLRGALVPLIWASTGSPCTAKFTAAGDTDISCRDGLSVKLKTRIESEGGMRYYVTRGDFSNGKGAVLVNVGADKFRSFAEGFVGGRRAFMYLHCDGTVDASFNQTKLYGKVTEAGALYAAVGSRYISCLINQAERAAICQ